MTKKTQWGDWIELVDGDFPEWVIPNEDVMFRWPTGIEGGPYYRDCVHHCGMGSFRLPADHWAYTAIARGFEPWGGGDCAPDDWDGGAVLTWDGNAEFTGPASWTHPWYGHGYNGETDAYDVSGYRKRALPAAAQPEGDGDYVRVKRMTRKEWISLDISAWALDNNLVFDETDVERFERETRSNLGRKTRKVASSAIEWAKKEFGHDTF